MGDGDAVTSAEHEVTQGITLNPRTPLGKRLWKLRQEIQITEKSLLDWDGVIREVQERRGEHDDGVKR